MKKLLIIIAVSILVFSELSAQNNYYWSGGKKLFLDTLPGVFVVQLKAGKSFKHVKQNFEKKPVISQITRIKNQVGWVFTENRGGKLPKIRSMKAFGKASLQFWKLPFLSYRRNPS
jgi:hypothetical protein